MSKKPVADARTDMTKLPFVRKIWTSANGTGLPSLVTVPLIDPAPSERTMFLPDVVPGALTVMGSAVSNVVLLLNHWSARN